MIYLKPIPLRHPTCGVALSDDRNVSVVMYLIKDSSKYLLLSRTVDLDFEKSERVTVVLIV